MNMHGPATRLPPDPRVFQAFGRELALQQSQNFASSNCGSDAFGARPTTDFEMLGSQGDLAIDDERK